MPSSLTQLQAALAGRYSLDLRDDGGPAEIGRGGWATVFRAHDLKHDRPVALKVLHPEVAAALGPERFLREIRFAARLQHPHIIPLFDSGNDAGQLWYTMPYVEGDTLRARLQRETQLPLDDAIRIALEIADALAYAHSHGIVHRDIKPENVLLSGGHALVADFGIARAIDASAGDQLTETGFSVGTPAYMSPEQAVGAHPDGRTDIYSMGCVLYEMLAGDPPFPGVNPRAVLARHSTEPVPSLTTVRETVSVELDQVIRKALAKTPADRYATAIQFRDALSSVHVTSEPRPGPPAIAAGVGQGLVRPASRSRARMIGALAILLGLIAYWITRGVPSRLPVAAVEARDSIPPMATEKQRLAVLPFQNLSAEAENQYFADGMSEEVTSALSKIGGLRVIARSSVQPLVGKDIAEVGRTLRVGSVLQGSVRRALERVRISVQLVDVASRENVWTNDYDGELKDVLAVQSDVAQKVAQALQVRLAPEEQSRVRRSVTENTAAYDSYLRGLYYARARGNLALENDSAISLFETATRLDPGFARAHAALARAYTRRLFHYDADPRWEQQAFVEITKALELDSTLAEAYLARGELAWTKANGFRHQEAILDYRRALRYKPNLREAHSALGRVYYHVGLLDAALVELRAAAALDPTDDFATARIAQVHYFQGQLDSALVEFESKEGWGDFQAHVLRKLGRRQEGLRLLDSLFQSVPQSADSSPLAAARAVHLAQEGRFAEAKRWINIAIRSGQSLSHFHHAEYDIGVTYALMGDRRLAVRWLAAAAREGFPCYPYFASDPDLASLRNEPAFQALLERLRTEWEHFKALI